MRKARLESVLLVAASFAASAAVFAPRADAQSFVDRLYLQGEGGIDEIVAGAQTQQFGIGGRAIARVGLQIVGPLSVQVTAGNWWFDAQSGAPGRLITFEGGLRAWFRLRPGVLGGPFVDANAGLGITGGLDRFAFDAAVGWDFVPIEWFAVGPVVRFTYVMQDGDQTYSAPILGGGIVLTLRLPRATPPAAHVAGDSDHDGVRDDVDRCPNEPEDVDGFRDDDGCPDSDNDDDGIPDASDRCPNAPETRNGFQDDDGCPDTPPPPPPQASPPPRTELEEHMEQLSQRVLFGFASAHLRHEFRPMLAQICADLRAHPEMTRLRVVGHADERGTDASNLQLSVERANAVVEYLVGCGIEARRLEPAGRGESDLECHDNTEECHQRNRRVQFIILERGSSPAP